MKRLTIPQPILLASASIAEDAEMELGCQLNPNLPLTLADHLSFAVERLENGISLTAPIDMTPVTCIPENTS